MVKHMLIMVPMIKLKDILLEIGDGSSKAFPWQYHEEHPDADSQDFVYTFETQQGTYIAMFTLSGDSEWDLAFGKGGGGTDTNFGAVTGVGAFRVMATIIEIIKDFLQYTYKAHVEDKELYTLGSTVPNKISFNTTKEPGRSEKEDSRRSNLYKAYIQKQVPGARVEKQLSGAHGDAYTITLPQKLGTFANNNVND